MPITLMPHSSLRQCTYPGCYVLVKSGRCPEHSTKKVQRDPDIKRMYNSKRWQSMRAVHLAQEPWCRDCLKANVYEFATDVDHIEPHKGDPVLFFSPKNLQSLCPSHHSSKTANEVWHSHDK